MAKLEVQITFERLEIAMWLQQLRHTFDHAKFILGNFYIDCSGPATEFKMAVCKAEVRYCWGIQWNINKISIDTLFYGHAQLLVFTLPAVDECHLLAEFQMVMAKPEAEITFE